MRLLLLAGTSLLALAASLATASATPTPVPFSDTTVGSTTFTAPSAGIYDILAFGAQGGRSGGGTGGLGAEIGGDFMLTAGEMLTIAVGGVGGFGTLAGGGGSFVVVQGTAAPLVIAGSVGGSTGGRNGNGGQANPIGAGGGSGGGLNGAGGSGGGGYSGGGGGANGSGGGGGSFDGSVLMNADFLEVAGVNAGDGRVTINLVALAPVPEPASLALFGTGLAGLLALGRRRRC